MCVCVCSFMCTGCILGFTRLGNLGTLILSVIKPGGILAFLWFWFWWARVSGSRLQPDKGGVRAPKDAIPRGISNKGLLTNQWFDFPGWPNIETSKRTNICLIFDHFLYCVIDPVVWDQDSECLILSRQICADNFGKHYVNRLENQMTHSNGHSGALFFSGGFEQIC